ncbi:MAG: hypothetical protein WAZ98_03975 [Cyclobacteriaceae bacterium]
MLFKMYHRPNFGKQLLLTFLITCSQWIWSCKPQEKNDSFEANRSYESVDKNFKNIATNSDLTIIYLRAHDVELRKECKVLRKENGQWSKLSFHISFQNVLTKVNETTLSETEGSNLFHRLTNHHIFDIIPEEALLEEHNKLCGKPYDPSHFLEFNLILVSGENVRELHFSNPSGRFEMCPAIKQWDNAAKISDLFEKEWVN